MEMKITEDNEQLDENQRAIRNANDPLDTSISHLQVATCITNAIHLQFGLLNGTVPLDDVVGELLYSGIVKPKDMREPVEKVLEDLKSLNIDKEVETKKAETAYEILNEMKELVQDVKEIGKGLLDQAFEGDLKVLETNGFDLKVPGELEKAVNGFEHLITNVRKYQANGEDQKAVDTFQNLISEIDSLLSKSKELDADAIVQIPSNKTAVASFAPILNQAKAVKLYADRKSQLETSTERKEKLLENLQEMARASEEASKILGPLEAAKSILEPQNPPKPILTAGFPNGVDDLNLLFSQDPWFEELTDTEALYKQLAPISKFFDEVKKVSDGIAPLKPAPIDEILEFVKPFNVSSIPKDFGTDQMFACIKTLPFGTTVTPFAIEPLSADIAAIDAGVEELRAAIRDMSSFLEKPQTISIIKEMREIALEATTVDQKLVAATIEKFLDPEKIGVFEKMIGEFKEIRSDMTNKKVKGLATKVSSQKKTLDSFQKTLDELKPAFECLQPLEDAKVTGQLIATWKTMQVPKQEAIKEVVKILKTLDAMPASVVDDMKSLDTGELHLKDSELHSTTLGLATRGISVMRDLLKQEANFELIEGLPGKETLKKTHTALVTWKGGVEESENLSGYGRIYEEALKVPGVDGFEKIGEEVRDLEEKETDPKKKKELKKVINATEELGMVGLDFSGYSSHFRNAPKSLEAMELFFAALKPRETTTEEVTSTVVVTSTVPLTSTLVATVPSHLTQMPQVIGIVIETTTIGYWEDNKTAIIIVVIVVVAFISGSVIGCLCYCYSWCCFKKKIGEVKEDVEDGRHPPQTPLTTTSPVPTTAIPMTPVPPPEAPRKKVPEKGKSPSEKSRKSEVEQPKKRAKKEGSMSSSTRSTVNTPGSLFPPAPPAPRVSPCGSSLNFVKRVNLEVKTYAEKERLSINVDCFYKYAHSLISNIPVTGQPSEHNENRYNPYNLVLESLVLIEVDLYKPCMHRNNYINANCFTLPNGKTWFMTQTPFIHSEEDRTNDKFFFLAAQTGSEVIVSIVSREEYEKGLPKEPNYNKYYPRKVGETINLMRPKYDSTFTVKCVGKNEKLNGKVTLRHLKLDFWNCNGDGLYNPVALQTDTTNTGNCEEKEERRKKPNAAREKEQLRIYQEHLGPKWVTAAKFNQKLLHIQLVGWPANGPPEDPEAFKEVLELCRGKRVTVHCADGVERSGMFVAAELARQRAELESCKHSPVFDPAPWFKEVFGSRAFLNTDRETKEVGRAQNVLFILKYVFNQLKEMEHKEEGRVKGAKRKFADFETNINRPLGLIQEGPTQESLIEDPTQGDD